MTKPGDMLDRILNEVECGQCGWFIKAGTGSQALSAAAIIHACHSENNERNEDS